MPAAVSQNTSGLEEHVFGIRLVEQNIDAPGLAQLDELKGMEMIHKLEPAPLQLRTAQIQVGGKAFVAFRVSAILIADGIRPYHICFQGLRIFFDLIQPFRDQINAADSGVGGKTVFFQQALGILGAGKGGRGQLHVGVAHLRHAAERHFVVLGGLHGFAQGVHLNSKLRHIRSPFCPMGRFFTRS